MKNNGLIIIKDFIIEMEQQMLVMLRLQKKIEWKKY